MILRSIKLQRTIFVIDDNDMNLTVAREALKEQYRVITIPSALKMFNHLEKVKPDIILLDVYMPDMDGFEALSNLKNNNEYKDIPVIFLTGTINSSITERGYELGVVDFILKPFSKSDLIDKINSHLTE